MKIACLSAALACTLILLTFFSCIHSEENKIVTKRVDYSVDSARAIEVLIWAADNLNTNQSVDTLKPLLSKFEHLWYEYRDTMMWKVYSRSLFEVGFGFQLLGKYDSSFSYLLKCYELCMEQRGEKYLLTTMCLNKLAFYYEYSGDVKKQKEYLLKSFEIRKEILDSNDLFLSFAYGNVADFYNQIGDHSKAELYGDKAFAIIKNQFDIFEKTIDPLQNKKLLELHGYMPELPKMISSVLTSIPIKYASILLRDTYNASVRKEFKLADQKLKRLDEVLTKYPELRPRLKSAMFRIKADYGMHKGDFLLTKLCLDSLIDFHKSIQSKEGLMGDYYQKSYALSMLGKFPEAIELINRHLSADRNNSQSYNLRLWRLTQLSSEGGLQDLTLKLCDSAYQFLLTKEQYDSLKFNQVTWSSLQPVNISKLLFYLYHDVDGSIKNLKIRNDASLLFTILDRFELFNRGLIYLQERNFTEEGKISQEIQYYPLYEKVMNLAAEAWSETGNDKYVNSLLNWSDAHKSIALRNSIILKSEISDHQPEGVLFQALELQNEIERTKVRIRGSEIKGDKKDSTLVSNLKSSLVDLTGDLEILQSKHQAQLSLFYNPNERMGFPMEEFTQYLKQNNAQLIDYFIGDEYLTTTLVSPQGKFCFSKKITQSEKESIDSFNLLIKQKNVGKEIKQLARDLYKLLIEPIETKLTSGHLIIIPDGILFKLPFDLLENDKGEPLIKKFPIQYEFSTKLLLQKANKTAKNSYSGFAPEYDGKEKILVSNERAKALEDFYSESRSMLGALHFNGPEVREGAQIMDGESYTGTGVDKKMFLEKSRNARIVHLAMHALTDDNNPDYSQLIFKSGLGNEPLFAYELNGWTLNAELAILSACNTGVGKYLRGDGVQSLARAFKSAGCKNIVMSLWPANDASTKEIVIGFLRYLKSGKGKSEALQQAKLDYLQNNQQVLKSPYYWAGMVLIGDNERIDFGPGPARKGVYTALLSILIFGLMYAFRRLE